MEFYGDIKVSSGKVDAAQVFESTDTNVWIEFKDDTTDPTYSPKLGVTGNNLFFKAGSDDITDFFIKSDGNVGIGTTDPQSTLDVNGTIAATTLNATTLNVTNVSTTNLDVTGLTSGYVPYINSDTLSDSVLYINGTSVGIGTTSLSNKLTVGGDGWFNGNLYIGNDGPVPNAMQLSFQSNDVNVARISGYTSDDSNGNIQFFTANAGTLLERMKITSDGKVGVGTTTPDETLSVVGEVAVSGDIRCTAAGNFGVGVDVTSTRSDCWANYQTHYLYGVIGTHGAFETNITSNGYRNSSGQWTSLGVNGYTGASQVSLNPQGYLTINTASVVNTGGAYVLPERMRITSAGYVGIGTNDPESVLHVKGGQLTLEADNGYTFLVHRAGGTNSAHSPVMFVEGYRGTLSSPTAMQDTNTCWAMQNRSHDGTGFNYHGTIMSVNASGNWTASSSPYEIRFGTVPSGSTSSLNGLVISDQQYVGIHGEADPDAPLHVLTENTSNGISAVSTILRHPATNMGALQIGHRRDDSVVSGRWSYIQSYSNEYTNAVPFILQPNGGNVGIGTTNPGAKLHVVGDQYLTGGLNIGYGVSTASAIARLGTGRTGSGYAYIDLVGDTTYSTYGLRIIRNNGGANTTSAIVHRGTGEFYLQTQDGGDIGFTVGSNRVLTMVGTDIKSYGIMKFQRAIGGVSYEGGNVVFEGSADYPSYFTVGKQYANFRIVTTSSTNHTLLVKNNGTGEFLMRIGGAIYPDVDNFSDVGAPASRWDDVYATNGVIQTSDARQKENVVELNSSTLSLINSFRPVSFTWKSTENQTFTRTHYGLLAQEVEQTLTDLNMVPDNFAPFIHDTETDSYGIRYSELVPMLIQCVKELTARIETLENA